MHKLDFSGLEREIRKSVKSNRTENDGPNRTTYFLYPSWQSISRSERESNEITSPPSHAERNNLNRGIGMQFFI